MTMIKKNLNEAKIIDGFRKCESAITREYFYGYCRRAYAMLDAKYQLHNKVGLDFYSLAHEYYIQLLTHDFRPLMDKPQDVPLSSWMLGGFRFVVLDAIKAYNKEFEAEISTPIEEIVEYVRVGGDDGSDLMAQVVKAIEAHYTDKKMHIIAHLLFNEGYKQKEAAARLGLTPAALNQRYKKMMDEVIAPFVMEYYGTGLGDRIMQERMIEAPMDAMPVFNQISPSYMSPSRFESFLFEEDIQEETNIMEQNRITPHMVSSLGDGEIFVFGSNLRGFHAGGAARTACQLFGAVMGQGVGLQGQSYAIPTMQGGVGTIRPYVDEFLEFAKAHPELRFFVTPIGCGIAGFRPNDIAPLFAGARNINNVCLPESFWRVLEME